MDIKYRVKRKRFTSSNLFVFDQFRFDHFFKSDKQLQKRFYKITDEELSERILDCIDFDVFIHFKLFQHSILKKNIENFCSDIVDQFTYSEKMIAGDLNPDALKEKVETYGTKMSDIFGYITEVDYKGYQKTNYDEAYGRLFNRLNKREKKSLGKGYEKNTRKILRDSFYRSLLHARKIFELRYKVGFRKIFFDFLKDKVFSNKETFRFIVGGDYNLAHEENYFSYFDKKLLKFKKINQKKVL